jgi:hypothetical protein
MASPDLEKESPESWQRSSGLMKEESRRYPSGLIVTAKQRKCARCSAVYRRPVVEGQETLHQRLTTCGDYLLPSGTTSPSMQSEVAWRQLLHEASALPSVRHQTGRSKALKAYLDRWEVIQVEKRL